MYEIGLSYALMAAAVWMDFTVTAQTSVLAMVIADLVNEGVTCMSA